jgi:23S rRNA pseudouridine2605 synthase
LGDTIDPAVDKLKIDNKLIKPNLPAKVYWVFNKPLKYLTARIGQDDKSCIFDLPALKKLPFTVATVGRLDYMSEGLILLSNDGELVFRLSHPKYKLPRVYQVSINGELSKEQIRQIQDGVELMDGRVTGCEIKACAPYRGDPRGKWYQITVHEGRNRLVRRILNHFDFKVLRLVRVGFGQIVLPDDLQTGKYRQLDPRELKALKKAVQL